MRALSRPPESGGQRNLDCVSIASAEVPEPNFYSASFGTSARAASGRAALLTQEGVADNLRSSLSERPSS